MQTLIAIFVFFIAFSHNLRAENPHFACQNKFGLDPIKVGDWNSLSQDEKLTQEMAIVAKLSSLAQTEMIVPAVSIEPHLKKTVGWDQSTFQFGCLDETKLDKQALQTLNNYKQTITMLFENELHNKLKEQTTKLMRLKTELEENCVFQSQAAKQAMQAIILKILSYSGLSMRAASGTFDPKTLKGTSEHSLVMQEELFKDFPKELCSLPEKAHAHLAQKTRALLEPAAARVYAKLMQATPSAPLSNHKSQSTNSASSH